MGQEFYLPPENWVERRIANLVRARYGARFVAAAGARSLRHALRELRARRGPFIIFVDELIRGRVQAPLFGRPLRLDSNIAYAVRLAAMTNAVVIPAYCVRREERAWFKVQFLPPLHLTCTGNEEADVVENAMRLDAVITPIVRAHLDQWYYLLDLDLDS